MIPLGLKDIVWCAIYYLHNPARWVETNTISIACTLLGGHLVENYGKSRFIYCNRCKKLLGKEWDPNDRSQ